MNGSILYVCVCDHLFLPFFPFFFFFFLGNGFTIRNSPYVGYLLVSKFDCTSAGMRMALSNVFISGMCNGLSFSPLSTLGLAR